VRGGERRRGYASFFGCGIGAVWAEEEKIWVLKWQAALLKWVGRDGIGRVCAAAVVCSARAGALEGS
jgi:hypothetical protein